MILCNYWVIFGFLYDLHFMMNLANLCFFFELVDFLSNKLGIMPSKSDLSQSEMAGLISIGVLSWTSWLFMEKKSELVAIVVRRLDFEWT